jgi:hypothetical protein
VAGPTASLQMDAASKRVIKTLTERLKLEKLQIALFKFMGRKSKVAAGRVSSTMLSGQRLKRRTGTLARSVDGIATYFPSSKLPGMRVGILRGPALKYAGAQEKGAIIKPVRAKNLAIPTDKAKTRAGVDRFGGPRGYPGELKFVPFRHSGVAVGGLFDAASLKRAKGDLSRAIMLYVLVKRVKIEAKHYLRDGFRSYFPELVHDVKVFLTDFLRVQQKEASVSK